MFSSVPAPRDGATPIPASPPRSRPWPSSRRFVLPIVAAAALTLGTSGTALACVLPQQQPVPVPQSQCEQSQPCHKKPITSPSQPEDEKTQPVSTEKPEDEGDTATPTPTPAPNEGTSEEPCTDSSENGDTCHVVTGSPSFTG